MKKRALVFNLAVFILLAMGLSYPVLAGELRVTEEHPFLVEGNWISANQLRVGDELTTVEGKKVRIINLEDVETRNPFLVYNLEAKPFNDFVVESGDDLGVIVHNSNRNCPWWRFGNNRGNVINPLYEPFTIQDFYGNTFRKIVEIHSFNPNALRYARDHLLTEAQYALRRPGLGKYTPWNAQNRILFANTKTDAQITNDLLTALGGKSGTIPRVKSVNLKPFEIEVSTMLNGQQTRITVRPAPCSGENPTSWVITHINPVA